MEQNEIWHSFILSLCQGHLPHLLPVSKGPSSKWQPSEIFWICKMLTLQEFSLWVVYNIVQVKVMVEILHKWFVQILQYQIYAMNNELSVPGEGGKLKLQRRRRPIWVVQRRALVSKVLEQSERCELSNQFFGSVKISLNQKWYNCDFSNTIKLRHPAQFFSQLFPGVARKNHPLRIMRIVSLKRGGKACLRSISKC